MGDIESIPELSANLKKAIFWISETVQEHPTKSRNDILTEAELRFDLTPRECAFLDQNFRELTTCGKG